MENDEKEYVLAGFTWRVLGISNSTCRVYLPSHRCEYLTPKIAQEWVQKADSALIARLKEMKAWPLGYQIGCSILLSQYGASWSLFL